MQLWLVHALPYAETRQMYEYRAITATHVAPYLHPVQTTAYGWSDGTNGLYVGCLCLGMLPGQCSMNCICT